jgi:predicted TIM-barrel fold metal-dependent hydrolase
LISLRRYRAFQRFFRNAAETQPEEEAMERSLRVNFPPDPNPRKPRLEMPAGAWDTHFHIWGPPHLFPYAESRPFTPPASPIEHYLAVAEVLGFERGVVVQPSVHKDNPAVIVDALRKSQGRLKGMIAGHCMPDDAGIRELHAEGVRGVRIELTRKLDGVFDRTQFQSIVTRAARANWVVALHLDTESIGQVADLIHHMPTQTVIENYIKLDPRLGLDQPALRLMLDLADEPHVWLKTASTYRMLRNGASNGEIVALARLVHARSPDRTIWGTDWPHGDVFKPGQQMNDGDIVDALIDQVPDPAMRRKLLVDNPKRLFDFD